MENYQTISTRTTNIKQIQSANPNQPLILKSPNTTDDNLLTGNSQSHSRIRKRRKCCGKCVDSCEHLWKCCCSCIDWSLIGNTFYDLLNIFITVADIITDSLVTYNFYENNQMTFLDFINYSYYCTIIICSCICSQICW